jgi:hypothetical protein
MLRYESIPNYYYLSTSSYLVRHIALNLSNDVLVGCASKSKIVTIIGINISIGGPGFSLATCILPLKP